MGKLWGLFRKGLQGTDRLSLVIAGEVRVLECHTDIFVPHKGLYRWQILMGKAPKAGQFGVGPVR